ncbi:MAG: polyamine aminopropyltransferase [Candidatus Portnoybacteria bacterium]|nr:polyamine aminopropyltransferase [Candidatus Portnoybacteria bacterium]
MAKNFWLLESASLYKTVKLGLAIKRKIFSKKTPYQKIEIVDSLGFGKVLFIDGLVQTTQADEFIYHEMISHVPLLLHPNPKKVLIIGGGDGGVLREVLKHPVKEAIMVEIDQDVIRACERFMPEISEGAFQNKNAKIIIDDGFKFVKNQKDAFDLIIVDSCDPLGPAKKLFNPEFYKNVYLALKKEGVAVFQSGSTFMQQKELRAFFEKNKSYFPFVRMYLTAIPTYEGGFYGFTLVSKKINPDKEGLAAVEKKFKNLNLKTKYYNPQIHFASFVLPNYIKDYLTSKK